MHAAASGAPAPGAIAAPRVGGPAWDLQLNAGAKKSQKVQVPAATPPESLPWGFEQIS